MPHLKGPIATVAEIQKVRNEWKGAEWAEQGEEHVQSRQERKECRNGWSSEGKGKSSAKWGEEVEQAGSPGL